MPSYMVRSIVPAGLIARAKARARDAGQNLDALIVAWLESYAEHGTIHHGQAIGGRARWEGVPPDERSALARKAVQSRKDRTPPLDGAEGE